MEIKKLNGIKRLWIITGLALMAGLAGAGCHMGINRSEPTDHKKESASDRKDQGENQEGKQDPERKQAADPDKDPSLSDPYEKTEEEKGAGEDQEKASQDGKKTADLAFDIPDKVVNLYTGQTLELKINYTNPKGGKDQASKARTKNTGNKAKKTSQKEPRDSMEWTSSNQETVRVDEYGHIQGLREGNAVIRCKTRSDQDQVCVNVYDGFGQGPMWDMDMLLSPDQTRTFRNYAQGAYIYSAYSEYIAMHGCALCCTTTIVRAWYPDEGWNPETVTAKLELEADEEGWTRNYAKSMPKQMPLTLKGISRIFDRKDIPHKYITKFDMETLTDQLAAELRKGHPIVYEAGNGGYHMMLILGIMADGDFIVSDSVGQDRVKAMSPDTVAGQMFSCKKEPKSSYFAGRKTAGGYIVVGK